MTFRFRLKPLLSVALTSAMLCGTLSAQAAEAVYGEQLEGFHYPYPLQHFTFSSQQQSLSMGYMDVKPAQQANGQTVVLMHGKTLRCHGRHHQRTEPAGLSRDCAGSDWFCTSTKPARYQYSFQQLAQNTHQPLAQLGVEKAVIVGHSTGGMLATRYALMYPQQTQKLVLVNPIGLRTGRRRRAVALGGSWYQRELKLDAAGIKKYEQHTYYSGQWKPEYDKWVQMLAGLNKGPGHEKVAWNSALIYDMIFTQPVYYEFKDLKVPTTLMIGTADTTAIGSDIASPAVKAQLGHYNVLGKQVAQLIPGARLIEFPVWGTRRRWKRQRSLIRR